MESDTHVVSLNLISDLIISLFYDKKSIVPVFELSKKIFTIIEASLGVLNCNDEVKLRSLNNSDLKVDWRLKLSEWTPHGINDADLRIIYMVNCVSIFTIYKLYLIENQDLCLNPFLGFFLKLWKIFTNLVLLGLEIDRRIESDPTLSTPSVVRQVIRGTSSMRYVLATILNDDVSNRYHDLNHVNIANFLSPFARENGFGSLHADVRWYVGAMLALGSDLNEVVETLVDLEPNDRYDEDVRYMFDYEYEDFHYEEIFQDDEEEEEFKAGGSIVYEDEDGRLHRVVRKRCTCEFYNNEPSEDADYKFQDSKTIDPEEFSKNMPTAVRSEETIEFDEMGRDWRDIPRGGNIFFNTQVSLNESDCLDWETLVATFDKMSRESVDNELAQKVIFTIARAVKLEFEQEINRSVGGEDKSTTALITPDMIYEKWSYEWLFEPILRFNPLAAYAMLDEMLMAHGYRRVIIWFITHLTLSFPLMNYICELVVGVRGETTPSVNEKGESSAKPSFQFKFSRQGSLEISEIEKSMLLHEFLNNCLVHLSKDVDNDDEELQNVSLYEKKAVTIRMVCILITKFVEEDKIDLQEYKIELTSLLINWIGNVPEARQLFFQVNKNGALPTSTDEEDEEEGRLVLKKATKKNRKFNQSLKVLLGNVLRKIADTNKTGSLLFQPFFELIDHDNKIPESEETDKESKPLGPIDFLQTTEEPNFLKGELKPLIRNEEVERARFEEAIRE